MLRPSTRWSAQNGPQSKCLVDNRNDEKQGDFSEFLVLIEFFQFKNNQRFVEMDVHGARGTTCRKFHQRKRL